MKTLSDLARDFEILADGSKEFASRCTGSAHDNARWHHTGCESTYRWCAKRIREWIEQAKEEEDKTFVCPFCGERFEPTLADVRRAPQTCDIADGPF